LEKKKRIIVVAMGEVGNQEKREGGGRDILTGIAGRHCNEKSNIVAMAVRGGGIKGGRYS